MEIAGIFAMTYEELHQEISNLIPHDNWDLTEFPSGNFTLWSGGTWIALDEPADRVLFALQSPEEYDAEIDREVAKILVELRGER